MLGRGLGFPADFSGPMAKPQRMALLTILAVYIGLTPGTWQPRWHDWGLTALALAIVSVGGIITALRRLSRIAANLQKIS